MFIRRLPFTALLGLTFASAAQAEIPITDDLTAFGDFRLRYDGDAGTRNASGTPVDNRPRLRYRARAGLKYDVTEAINLRTRIRTATTHEYRSPHITLADFSGNPRGDEDVDFDIWTAEYKQKNGTWAWAGRNVYPFHNPNEAFWDEDATILGMAGGFEQKLGTGTLKLNAGAFTPPITMHHFSNTAFVAEAFFKQPVNDVTLTATTGLRLMEGDSDSGAANRLSQGNGARDYALFNVGLEAARPVHGIPARVAVDVIANLENYSPADPDTTTATFHNNTEGYIITLAAGDTKKQGNWLAAYYYFHLEQFAINNAYNTDDYSRFSSSDLKGHELRFGYAFRDDLNVIVRNFITESITDASENNRFRVDVNFRF